jgi:PAS domain S-box-containing protein
MARAGETRKRTRATPARRGDYDLLRAVKELEWLRTLAHVSPVGIFRADGRGLCSYVNERWCEITGYPASAALGTGWELAIHPEEAPAIREEWERCCAERRPFRMEHRYVQPGGRVVWALTQLVREVDGQGRATGYTGMTTDITELHQTREELQRSHAALEVRMRTRAAELQRMARIVETIDDAVVSADLGGRIVSWNRGAENIFGYTAAEMLGQSVVVLAPDMKREEAREFEERVRGGGEIHHFETMGITKAGALFEIAVSGFPLRDEKGAICGSWAILRDISERKRTERRLQRLSWRLLRAQDDERRRLARELHDSTAQAIAALAMNLAALAREDPPLSGERRRQLLRDSLSLAEHASVELRTTSYLLHPPLLDERGLPAALRWFADGFSSRSSIRLSLDLAPNVGRMPAEVETALFRVAQESLHNIHRHSGSETAEIRLSVAGDVVSLEVRDWGRGLPSPAGELVGVGVAGMRERLLQIEGTLTIEQADPGTRIVARVSISR